MTKEQGIEMFKKVANECAVKEGGSAADIAEALEHKMPSTQTGKCMHACFGETSGFVRLNMNLITQIDSFYFTVFYLFSTTQMKDNKVNVEANVEMAKKVFDNDPLKVQTATDIANECAAVTDPDRCEAAVKIFECFLKATSSRGIKMGDW